MEPGILHITYAEFDEISLTSFASFPATKGVEIVPPKVDHMNDPTNTLARPGV
jgi:hypothetical protein